MVRYARSTRILLAAVVAGILFAGCAGRVKGPVLLHPLPPEKEGYTLTKGALVFDSSVFRVTARPVDWRVVESELNQEGAFSPFGTKKGSHSPFVFFSLLIENLSDQPLYFSTFRSSVASSRSPLNLPLDLSDLYIIYEGAPDLERRALAFKETCYDGAVTVSSGESIERYLVFEPPSGKKARNVELVLDEIFIGTDSFQLRFPFEVFPTETGKKKKNKK